jgi:hypothetical protein
LSPCEFLSFGKIFFCFVQFSKELAELYILTSA